MEILTYKNVYQIVGDQTSGSDECITKSQAVAIANEYRKSVTSNLSLYLDNEYIDRFAVEDKTDLSMLTFDSKTFNPASSATTLSTTAKSLDIDGLVIPYTATADVDWITDIKIDGDVITFNVTNNTGSQRVGHIIGTNSAGKSDTITITQEAADVALKYTYKLIAKNATGVPNITINGEQITPELSGDDYVYEYVLRATSESESIPSVPFTIANGGASSWTEDPSISVSPTSWDLSDGLTKQFTVSYSDTLYEKSWDIPSGTIPRDGSVTTTLTTSSHRQSPTVVYTTTDNAPDGSSFTYDTSDMSFSATASSTSAAPSNIKVAYNGVEVYVDVTYTPTLGPFYRWKNSNKVTYETNGETSDNLVYQKYYTKGGVEQDVTDETFTPSNRDVLYSAEDASGTETMSGIGLTWTWIQKANSRTTTSAILITEGTPMSSAGGTVKYIAEWRWRWLVGKSTAYAVGNTGELTYTYQENTSTSEETHTLRVPYSSSYAMFDDYGLTYPDATTTITQPPGSIHTTTVDVKANVSAKFVDTGGSLVNTVAITVDLREAVPFDVTVSGEFGIYDTVGEKHYSPYTVDIKAGSTSATSYCGNNFPDTSVLELALGTISPTSMAVNGITYNLTLQE